MTFHSPFPHLYTYVVYVFSSFRKCLIPSHTLCVASDIAALLAFRGHAGAIGLVGAACRSRAERDLPAGGAGRDGVRDLAGVGPVAGGGAGQVTEIAGG